MHRQGFSFAEVMFAVVILGVGFIMVAAVFPVATQQTLSTADEAVAARLARDAITTIQNSTHLIDYAPSENTKPFSATVLGQLWPEVQSSLIDPTDNRYAWFPFYSRATGSSIVQVTVLVVRRRIHAQYTPADLGPVGASEGALIPRGITINSIGLQDDGKYAVDIQVDSSSPCVSPGCFLVMTGGELCGRAIQVGQLLSQSDDSVTYELEPGSGIAPGDSGSGSAAVIGRDYKDPQNPILGFDGPAQDIAVYTTLISPN